MESMSVMLAGYTHLPKDTGLLCIFIKESDCQLLVDTAVPFN